MRPCSGEDTHQLIKRLERLSGEENDLQFVQIHQVRCKRSIVVWIIPVKIITTITTLSRSTNQWSFLSLLMLFFVTRIVHDGKRNKMGITHCHNILQTEEVIKLTSSMNKHLGNSNASPSIVLRCISKPAKDEQSLNWNPPASSIQNKQAYRQLTE